MNTVSLVAPAVIASTNHGYTILANPRTAYTFRTPDYRWVWDEYGYVNVRKGAKVILRMEVDETKASKRFTADRFCYAEDATPEMHPRVYHECINARRIRTAPFVRTISEEMYALLCDAVIRRKCFTESVWESGSLDFAHAVNGQVERVMWDIVRGDMDHVSRIFNGKRPQSPAPVQGPIAGYQ